MPVDPGFAHLLFADQRLDALTASIGPDSTEVTSGSEVGGWLGSLVQTGPPGDGGDRSHQIAALRALTGDESPARVAAWAWRALRDLGEHADEREREVLGAIVEVPLGGGSDIVAAYADGTARYLNHTGSAVIWDDPDDGSNPLVVNLLQAVATCGVPLELVDAHGELPATATRLSLVLPEGLRQGIPGSAAPAGEPEVAIDAALALMTFLVAQAQRRWSR